MPIIGTSSSANIKSFLFNATGGTVVTSGGYKYHTFTSNGTLAITGSKSIEYLIIAGGGGAGSPDHRLPIERKAEA